ncbi:MAG: adenylate/guanylate cyclase domain-containing protein [Alphaproteobacteria bacterium]|nr:adenylate/guanylate cyclase domain-containing protein [Alphaproteobacteria bacterium]
MAVATYEVWMKTSSEKDWEFVSSSTKKDAAMEQAKSIEFMQRIPTKVIREELNEQTERYESQTLYLSNLKPPEPVKPKVQQVYRSSNYTSASKNNNKPTTKYEEPKKGKQAQTFNEACFVLLFTLVLSFASSSAISFGIFNVLKAKSLIPEAYSHHCILATFIFFFILIEVTLSSKWVNFDVLSASDEDETSGSMGTPGVSNAEEKRTLISFFQNLHSYLFGNGHLRKVIEQQQKELAEKRQAELNQLEADLEKRDELEAAEEKKRAEEIEKQKKEEEELEKKKKEEALKEEEKNQKLLEEEREKKAKDLEKELELKDIEFPVKEKYKSSKLEDTKMPSELEKYNIQLTSFLSVVLKILQEQNTQFNAYARFGIELFLSGACDAVCHTSDLTRQENHHLLVSLLQLLGRTQQVAEGFYEKIDEYMLEPHYLTMFKNGSNTYMIYEKNGSHSSELVMAVSDAIQSWIDPDKKISKTSGGIITVMFTDIVGSTKMTQDFGDQVAQKLIRKHNAIVRKAIEEYNGTEIKHTGDGIMSSFSWASNALDAAIKIQKEIRAFNESKPTVELKVRIGLNSGEPIVEDNDLFGATVQIAARVCEKCDAEQIVVSNVVKELATGKNYTFYDIGMFDLKGIDAQQNLFSVAWWKSDLLAQNGGSPEKRVIKNEDPNDPYSKKAIEHEIALSKKMSEIDQIEVFESKLEEF